MAEFNSPIKLSKGIKMSELLEEHEFHLDVDFSKQEIVTGEDDYSDPDEDWEYSTTDEVLKQMEQASKTMSLGSPEYHSFSDLASQMVDCLPSGEVKMLIFEEGPGPLVARDAEVAIHYTAFWEKETKPFDSTLGKNKGLPTRIRLGVGKLLPGLEIGLTSVKGPTARFLLLLQPSMTWGPLGVLPRLKPEPALFNIQLYEVSDVWADIRFFKLPIEEQAKFDVVTKTVNALHATAKDMFHKKKYLACIQNYEQSFAVLNMCKPNDIEEEQVIEFKIKTCVNLAVCYYKVMKPKQIIQVCENLETLTDINKHCKALFYLSRAYEMLGNTDKAVQFYKKALRLEPRNKDIGNALARIDKSAKKGDEELKKMWQAAFKHSPVEKKKFNVDPGLVDGVTAMCETLVCSEEHAQFQLAEGLTEEELDCIKGLVAGFQGLRVQESGQENTVKIVRVPGDRV